MKTTQRCLLFSVLCLIVAVVAAQEPAESPKPADPDLKAADTNPGDAENPTPPGTKAESGPEATASEPAPAPKPVSEEEAKRAEALFQEGRKLFFQGKSLEAVDKLKQAVETNPARTSYQLLLARTHRSIKQNAQAIKVLEGILDGNAEHVEAGIELAELLTPKKHPERVIAILKPLLKLKHAYPMYHMLAEACYEREDFNEARKYFEEAVKLNPRNRADHYQLGNIYLAQKRFAKSASAYERAASLGMTSGAFHFKLASVYFNLHNYLGRITEAQVLSGKSGTISNNLYLIDPVPGKEDTFYAAGPRSAIYQAAKAQDLGIDIFEIRFLEANIWLSANRYARADSIYKELSGNVRKEDTAMFWSQWSQTALGLNDFESYIERLGKAIASDPDVYEATMADALQNVARRYQQRGDSKKFIEYLNKAVDRNPLSARLHLTLGDAYWGIKDKEKAILQYKLVLELEPDFAQRLRLVNRIRGEGETVSPLRPTASVSSSSGTRPTTLSFKCLLSGEPAKSEFTLNYRGGRTYFCCQSCRDEFTENLAQYSAQANHQLVQTAQASTVKCPVSGRKLDPKFSVDVQGVKVGLCCNGCKSRATKLEGDERLQLIFNNAAFSKSFAVRPTKR